MRASPEGTGSAVALVPAFQGVLPKSKIRGGTLNIFLR
jgi:hypothetical protein